jgi:hypothetical protein
MFIPNFGMGWQRGFGEGDPQPAPSGQLSLNNRLVAPRGLYGDRPDTDEDRIFVQPPKTDPDVSRPRLLPLAEEFQPHRPLTQQEIQELTLPGGPARVAARLRMERAAEAGQEQNFMDAMRRALPRQ